MKTIFEYLLSKSKPKILPYIDTLVDVLKEYDEKRFSKLISILDSMHGNENAEWACKLLLNAIDNKFELTNTQPQSDPLSYIDKNGNKSTINEKTKLIRLRTFGNTSFTIDILAMTTHCLGMIIIEKDNISCLEEYWKNMNDFVKELKNGSNKFYDIFRGKPNAMTDEIENKIYMMIQ